MGFVKEIQYDLRHQNFPLHFPQSCLYSLPAMNILSLASHELRKAADLVDKIEKLKGELAATLESSGVATEARKIKRRMSAAGRLAIAAAQKLRWSKVKGKSAKPTAKKRTLSFAAKAKIAAAAKKRWAKAKAAGKNSL